MVLKKIKALLTRRSKRSREAPTPPPQPAPEPARPHPERRAVEHPPALVHHRVSLQDLDQDAVRIVKRLTRSRFTAYLVGGCVRDLLLHVKPKDFDVGTSATPRQIKRLFSNCRIIGRRFRLAHVYFQNGKIIEVATFRARDAADLPLEAAEPEGAEDDDLLIRDDNVFGSPAEDALRRDFTINALFYDVNDDTVLDHVDGLGDLDRKLIRTIGDPVVRFREDPIRILRAIKFAARLDFTIEPKTLHALRQTRAEIPKAAAPRILEEFNRFCRSGAGRRAFELTMSTGVFEVILPELAPVYGHAGKARDVLFTLLDALDARWREGREVYPGEIFSALLFAEVAPALGWSLDAKHHAKRDGRDARSIVDDALRPIALRLRIARKDQERTRQTLGTLQRMVPATTMRRGARIALMRRPAFADAMAMVGALAPRLGGEFETARAAWMEIAAGHEPAAHQEATATHGASVEERARRRRGRRGGRGRRRDDAARPPGASRPAAAAPAPAAPPPAAPAAAAAKLPPVWDDNYFFAALPSVPSRDASDEAGSGPYSGGVMPGTAPPSDDSPSRPRRRRRRGGRRHRKGGPMIPPKGEDS
jgi:poly(A) polymerase